MRKAPQRSARRSSGLRHLGVLALVVAPFAGCFAEPKPSAQPDITVPGSGGAGGSKASSSGGHSASGGTKAASGGSGTTTGVPNFGGVPGDAGGTGEGSFGGEAPTTGASFKCVAPAAQPLPARKSVTSDSAPPPVMNGPTTLELTKQQLFDSFSHSCGRDGACHVGAGDPLATGDAMFRVTVASFDQRPTLGDDAVARITSSDPKQWMPPDLGSGAKRAAGDPFYDLGQKLLAWQKAHFPDPLKYTVDPGDTPTTPVTSDQPYLLNPELAANLTNLGSCIPNEAMPAPIMTEMQQKDAFFAGMNTSDDLPDTIYETDLVSLDSGELAKRRVFSYAPTYPLYSDSAGKMRYVRVPNGKSIRYDDTLKDFVIPDNTRFYKTFLKPVIDKDGNSGFRKMETRLLVVRQDVKNADGSYTPQTLRASYAWDKDEQMAHRVKDARDNGLPWADRLCPYVVDERVTRDPNKNPISDQKSEWCEYMTEAEMADNTSGQIRHYAIPSSDRCDQCHMGSSSHSYILGFTPWQVDRRPKGEGGLYEDPNDDELTQLQRFLDYGVITGIQPGQAKLEESQLPRAPRNDYELTAQAYMMGNCAFCHNDHGYPVVTNPVLKSFIMFPSLGDDGGGIFQFPLEKFSPRAKGGVSQTLGIPYITAALGDYVKSDYPNVNGTFNGGVDIDDKTLQFPIVTDWQSPDAPDWDGKTFTFLGPWRSLIWRNVYTPFTYNEDGTIYIHMPRNSSGFDCRLPKIMADWMLSIPVQAKTDTTAPTYHSQPVQEVSATDPAQKYAYGQAVLAAKKRLNDYAKGVTGSWCPSDDDIVDPQVILSPAPVIDGLPRPANPTPPDAPITGPRVIAGPPYLDPIDGTDLLPDALEDAVPNHFHWIPTDASVPDGKWVPRRSDWQSVIVDPAPAPPGTTLTPQQLDLQSVVADLQNVHLSSDFEQFALEQLPMGFWDLQCQNTSEASAEPTGKQIGDGPRIPLARWLLRQGGADPHSYVFADDSNYGGGPNSHVHYQSRGEAVVHAICQNCHGKQLDSKSALAATISELTGGETRVANFVAGLFGPPSAPGAYARDEFTIGHGADPEDWHARYVLFMGLGGTKAQIPQSVLNLVATSPFYGAPVTAPGANSPNMLGSAKLECQNVLSANRVLPKTVPVAPGIDDGSIFAKDTGHFELWESLCTYGNEPIVRVLYPPNSRQSNQLFRAQDDSGSWVYPPTALVGDQYGDVHTGIDVSNLEPWCMSSRNDQERQDVLTWADAAGLPEDSIPFCPDALFAQALGQPVYHIDLTSTGSGFGNQEFLDHWVRHGAINAGLSAFYFIRGFLSGTYTPSLPFDFCTQ